MGDSDLQTIGMNEETRERFHGLKAHLLDGAELPGAPSGAAGNTQIFADDGTTVLPTTAPPRRRHSASRAVAKEEAQAVAQEEAQEAAPALAVEELRSLALLPVLVEA